MITALLIVSGVFTVGIILIGVINRRSVPEPSRRARAGNAGDSYSSWGGADSSGGADCDAGGGADCGGGDGGGGGD